MSGMTITASAPRRRVGIESENRIWGLDPHLPWSAETSLAHRLSKDLLCHGLFRLL